MSDDDLKVLLEKAKEIRIKTIDSIGFLGVGHIGGAMSIVSLIILSYQNERF